jgi:hypothetical protein
MLARCYGPCCAPTVFQFTTSPRVPEYVLAPRGELTVTHAATITVVLLTEPSFIGDSAPGGLLSFLGFNTDGTVLPPVPLPTSRRMEVLGDSLTAGYGAGFDLPPGLATTDCGAGVLVNDVTNDYSYLLARNLSAQAHWVAQSGITLFAAPVNLPLLYNWCVCGRRVGRAGGRAEVVVVVPS